MEKIPFKVSARAGKLLGRENFSNPEGAVIELVKNAYDADAKNCYVIFDIVTDNYLDESGNQKIKILRDDSHIYIIDNGEGMTKKVIENNWMQIGTGNKEVDFISKNKRVKTGAKGIGRFALDRLGFSTEMWTKSNNEKGYHWKMKWEQFDSSDLSISDITADLIPLDNVKLKNLVLEFSKNHLDLEKIEFDTGTVLKISNLKDDWFDDSIEGVFKSLEALIPPKELKILFNVDFLHVQKPKEFGKVDTAFFNDYDYKISADYDSEKLLVNFEITRNELDLSVVDKKYSFLYKNSKYPYDLDTIKQKTFSYSKSVEDLLKWKLEEENTKLLKDLGSFSLTFYYLKFTNSLKEEYPYKSINQKERRTVLDKFGGVKIYRDSFRVRPYGDPDNDWLKLGSRAAQSPAGAGQRIGDWRVRPDQTAGIITISRKSNPLLIDKSDRGSLQENDTFEVFKNLIIKVIHEFEEDRSKILNVYYKYFAIERERKKEEEIQKRAEELADKIVFERKQIEHTLYGGKSEPIDLFAQRKEEEERKSYEQAFKDTFYTIENEKIEKDNEEIVQVRGLASLGLVVSSFAHELKEIKNNVHEIDDLEVIYNDLVPNDLKSKREFEDGNNILSGLKSDTQKITHWIEYSLNAIKKDKRKRTNLDLHKYFNVLSKDWNNVLLNRNIELIISKNDSDKLVLRCFEMDMNTIFSNLISNSIDSFQNLKDLRDRKIVIKIEEINGFLEINYCDNGIGLPTFFQKDKASIFKPFTTSKVDRKGKEIGTGLGMYLVKNVVDDYNGDIIISEKEEIIEGFGLKINLPIRKS